MVWYGALVCMEQDIRHVIEPTIKFKFTNSHVAKTSAHPKLKLPGELCVGFQRLSRAWLQAHTYFLVWMRDLACYASLGHTVWHPAASVYPIWAWDYNRWPEEGKKKKAYPRYRIERPQCPLPQQQTGLLAARAQTYLWNRTIRVSHSHLVRGNVDPQSKSGKYSPLRSWRPKRHWRCSLFKSSSIVTSLEALNERRVVSLPYLRACLAVELINEDVHHSRAEMLDRIWSIAAMAEIVREGKGTTELSILMGSAVIMDEIWIWRSWYHPEPLSNYGNPLKRGQ